MCVQWVSYSSQREERIHLLWVTIIGECWRHICFSLKGRHCHSNVFIQIYGFHSHPPLISWMRPSHLDWHTEQDLGICDSIAILCAHINIMLIFQWFMELNERKKRNGKFVRGKKHFYYYFKHGNFFSKSRVLFYALSLVRFVLLFFVSFGLQFICFFCLTYKTTHTVWLVLHLACKMMTRVRFGIQSPVCFRFT